MDLRQLEYFLQVAQRGNISAAAVDLNITQPTLTKSIRLLEQELGVKLFERLPRGVALTDFGRALKRHAEAVRIKLKDAGGEIEALRNGTFGSVAIGAGPAWLRRHLPQAVATVVAQHPTVRVRVDGGFDDLLFRALRDGELDFVVAELPSTEDRRDIDVMPLTSDRFGVSCRAGHPLTKRRRLAMRDLLPYPWVTSPRTTRSHRRLDALFLAQNLPPPRSAIETGSVAFLINTLRHSDALTFTTSKTLATREGADLAMLDVPQLRVTRQAGIVTRTGGWLPPAALLIIDALKAICAAEPEN
jgi:DNA-binding transcriptional LysR family regulator